MNNKRIIVIGGGASGLMAAGQAALLGADVLILEKMKRPGIKLSITGKGRCNITNVAPLHDFITHFGPNGRFLFQAFSQFFSNELIEFFNEIGVETEKERGGRVFPKNGEAKDVVERLIRWTLNNGVKISNNSGVKQLIISNNTVTGIQLENGKSIIADAVILATGGASYQGTGSTGDGYRIAKDVSHSIIPPKPALVPIDSKNIFDGHLDKLKLKNVNASLWIENKKIDQEFGELHFTKTGLSGPVILTMSSKIVKAIDERKQVEIIIDLKPALDDDVLDKRLLREIDANRNQKFERILKNLLPSQLISVCSLQTGIALEKTISEITAKERKLLRHWLKNFKHEITNYRHINEALITSGGVDLKEIDPKTMASKKVNRLYICGELLDLDADTGGYNLQAAFSTGWVAGRSAAFQE